MRSGIRGTGAGLRAFVGLDAKDDVLVGTASRLLTQEQTRGQARRLARDGHVVCSPRLAVLVHNSEPPAVGAVPDALLRPNRWGTGNITAAERRLKGINSVKKKKKSIYQKGSAKTSRPSKE